jgi:hypothetical protein
LRFEVVSAEKIRGVAGSSAVVSSSNIFEFSVHYSVQKEEEEEEEKEED